MPFKLDLVSFYGLWVSMSVWEPLHQYGGEAPSHRLPPDHRENSCSAVSLDTVPADWGQIWAHMVPIESANKRQTGALTQRDPLLRATEPSGAPLCSSEPHVANSQPSASI